MLIELIFDTLWTHAIDRRARLPREVVVRIDTPWSNRNMVR